MLSFSLTGGATIFSYQDINSDLNSTCHAPQYIDIPAPLWVWNVWWATLVAGKTPSVLHSTQHPCPVAPTLCHPVCSQVKLNSEARNTCWVSFDGRHQQELLVGDRLVWQAPRVLVLLSHPSPLSFCLDHSPAHSFFSCCLWVGLGGGDGMGIRKVVSGGGTETPPPPPPPLAATAPRTGHSSPLQECLSHWGCWANSGEPGN